MIIKRELEPILLHYASKFPVIAVVGPRQAGKTTVTKKSFPHHTYFSLEDPDTLEMVQADPRGFLEHNYGGQGIIIDEFQNDPKLLSYMQGIVDRNRRPGYFVLTGSHNFLMNQAITQSLAGRVAMLTLLPLSLKELAHHPKKPISIDQAIFNGGYPDIYARNILPHEFYPQYIKTYVERDVRQLMNVSNLLDFQKFMRLCAGRIGQLLNISSLADDCNVSVPTINSWISILQASYVIFLLQPHFENFSKRLIKSPKLYFYDTGLASWLLKITSVDQIHEHYLRGGLAESLILSELQKTFFHQGKEPSLYFWRDSHGHEIDCLIDYGSQLVPIEIKSSQTISQRFFQGLHYWCDLANVPHNKGFLIHAGTATQTHARGTAIGWMDAANVIDASLL